MDPSCRIDVEKVAQQGCALLRELGAQATCIKTAGLPLVLGRLVQDPKFPTVTIYNHLDVQPADAEEWRSPPFKLVRDGDRWLGRGTTDDKGPALAALFGARLALQDGVPSTSSSSGNRGGNGQSKFRGGASQTGKADKPLRTDSIVVSDSLWPQAGRPASRTVCAAWWDSVCACKPATRSALGTTGGAARNPLGELCALINDCYDARTGRVKIPGFYHDVRRLGAAERRGLSRAGFSRRHFQLAHGLSSVRFPTTRICAKRS